MRPEQLFCRFLRVKVLIMADLVSIVMPGFNSSDFIERAINSVLGQSWGRFEFIIIDDGSSDDTCEIVKRYAKTDERIRLIELERNVGAAAARNKGIDEAQGRYVAFLDSDDLWSREKLSVQIAAMEASESPLSTTGYRLMLPGGREKYVAPPSLTTSKNLLSGHAIKTPTAMMDVERIGRKVYMRDIKVCEDLVFWLDILQGHAGALGIPDDLVTVHVREVSLSSNKLWVAGQRWSAYRSELGLTLPETGYYFARYAAQGVSRYLL